MRSLHWNHEYQTHWYLRPVSDYSIRVYLQTPFPSDQWMVWVNIPDSNTWSHHSPSPWIYCYRQVLLLTLWVCCPIHRVVGPSQDCLLHRTIWLMLWMHQYPHGPSSCNIVCLDCAYIGAPWYMLFPWAIFRHYYENSMQYSRHRSNDDILTQSWRTRYHCRMLLFSEPFWGHYLRSARQQYVLYSMMLCLIRIRL